MCVGVTGFEPATTRPPEVSYSNLFLLTTFYLFGNSLIINNNIFYLIYSILISCVPNVFH